MIRDYIKGVHETLDVTIVNAGSAKNALRSDGIFKHAFYDLVFYSDSAYTTPITVSAYESTTIDTGYTINEVGSLDETIYSEYRILDPTYQTGTIYARFESLAVYSNGEAVGQPLTSIDASFSYTTNPYSFNELYEVNGLSADITITVSDGGSDQRNKMEVSNIDSTYKAIVTDSVNTYWVYPNETVSFYFLNSVLTRSTGWGVVYDVPSNTGTVLETSLLSGAVVDGDLFDMVGATTSIFSTVLRVSDITAANVSATLSYSSDARFKFFPSTTNYFDNITTTINVIKMYKWY